MKAVIDLEKFFLSKRPMRRYIKRDGKSIELVASQTAINGLYLDWRGYPWVTWWQPDNESSTESGREQRLWSSKDLRFRKYSYGIMEVMRGLEHALNGGREYATRVAEAQKFAEQFKEGLNEKAALNDQDLGHLWRKLQAVQSRLEGMRNKPVVEAIEKFEAVMIYRSSDGKFNIGVFNCRLTAADARLFERLKIISIWSIDYYQRLIQLRALKEEFYDFLGDLQAGISGELSGRPKFVNSLAVTQYLEIIAQLKFWQRIRPFRNWARLAISDYESYRQNLLDGKKQLAYWYLKRLKESITLKKIQGDVYKLIDDLSSCALRELRPGHWQYNRVDHYDLKQGLADIYASLKTLNDRDWKFPVKAKLRAKYREFQAELKKAEADFDKNRFTDPSQHQLFRQFLKDLSHMM